ncbi:helix-turn-helix domain-containing protein [Pectobacterium polonicum]|uniref:Helix-turn-helix domain-containing protein n=1 Tax=Pectobacterium polonicum TaxID=2485124 RepID=A0AAE9NT13_9GAMM|nr:helix-turn-helix domain-containing protein [Pectobacterium polonicum]MDC9820893.1 helix-turn-helix domain-containing protein [Pectobacterium polonicum]TKY82199.1 transcriptional regulator [Pectobacterium polonicum]UVO09087.1 helix-turn-helix transcriptional regulator [Pectobacterium polonicum]GKW25301.1 HxlR family transcriptional regulator [Pectobacterium carotovorum subsp. carotovorum]
MSLEAQGRALTDKVRQGELFTVDCPSREVLKHVSSLWGVLCLISLREGTLRFGELRRKVTGVSEKMLAQTLKRLEEDGFILRFSHPVVPPYVEYSLTPLGREVSDQIATLADWIELNISKIMDSRREKGAA